MHLYLWKLQRLENRLRKYIGGQFQIETTDGIYRGEVASYEVTKNTKERRLTVKFKWWCIRRIKNHDIRTFSRVVFWEEIPARTDIGEPCVDIRFKYYYFQKDREDRKERIKLRTDFNEPCRFYKPDDPTNLIRNENGEFVEKGPLQIIPA